ncbi:unnamed protein product [Bursaphelenchus xylophilus]|uniref:(pine wood nematode) hypothetical protein n=1 Tax=Bursaphelenchus xylophilus TaxID=6326 RepID=A0A1I7RJZ2_BURXY|nr:unnamed protein product [Bursaphelenchus xylophilus]CAG9131623.1 unnamed protein product [Bursaphelenchus xylophilus]
MRIAPSPRKSILDLCAQTEIDTPAPAAPGPLYNTGELNAPCNDWTSLSVICFGVCELTIRRNRSAAPSVAQFPVVD